MKRRVLGSLAALALLPALVLAKIEAPDHVIYGNVTMFGTPAPAGTVVELRSFPEDEPLVRYTLGRNPDLGNQFALRIPMDTVEPRSDGHARPGDEVRIFIGTRLAAETSVGEEGVAVRLDLDPQNMGTGPGILVSDAQGLEGNVGTSPVVFTLTLNTTSTDPVSVTWQTQDGSAVGAAACAAGVDYLSDGGTAVIPAMALTHEIAVQSCGDAVVENNETFSMLLSGSTGGVLQDNLATGTLIDDDDVPELIVPDTRALEPAAGSIDLVFQARLSRPSAVATSFTFATQNLTAVAGADYQSAGATVQIPAGQTQVQIRVPVLADTAVEPREQFRLVLSAPLALRLQRPEAFGDIVDTAYDPAVFPVEETEGPPGVLAAPSDIVVSPDGLHAYAASESLDRLVAYARNTLTGKLTLIASYTDQSAGFDGALLDGPSDLAMTTDGAFLYAAARNASAVAVLARNAGDGTLSYVQSQTRPAMQGATALHLSGDNQHLYVAGGAANALVVYQRDPGTGALTFVETETNNVDDAGDAGAVVQSLDRPSGIASSADGAQVYVASRFGNSVVVFNRTSAVGVGFGRLSYATSIRNGQGTVQGLAGAFDLVLSPDNLHLYVAAEAGNSVALFDRAVNGALTWRAHWKKGDPGVHGLGGAQAIAMSPDASQVYVAGFGDDSFTVFRRATSAAPGVLVGDLQIQQTVFDGEGQVNLMRGPVAIATSGDNKHIYVAASVDNAIVIFTREADANALFANGFE